MLPHRPVVLQYLAPPLEPKKGKTKMNNSCKFLLKILNLREFISASTLLNHPVRICLESFVIGTLRLKIASLTF
jgi:hypothetical protein